jgi:hypothetical protein
LKTLFSEAIFGSSTLSVAICYDWKLRSLVVVTSASASVSVRAFTNATMAVDENPNGGTVIEIDAEAVCFDVNPV